MHIHVYINKWLGLVPPEAARFSLKITDLGFSHVHGVLEFDLSRTMYMTVCSCNLCAWHGLGVHDVVFDSGPSSVESCLQQ